VGPGGSHEAASPTIVSAFTRSLSETSLRIRKVSLGHDRHLANLTPLQDRGNQFKIELHIGPISKLAGSHINRQLLVVAEPRSRVDTYLTARSIVQLIRSPQ
jgi:hypothetical protein